ncbi:MAG: helix-turn-helix transcriptional regulator [Mycobacterium sp.]
MAETTADYFSPEAFERVCDKSGLTRKEIAARLGVTPTSMSNMTSGRTTPSLKLLSRIVEVFGGELSDYLAMPARNRWKLQHFRVARGLTQGALAKCLGTSQAIVSNWELGKYPPSEEWAAKLGELYGVSPQEILQISASTAAAAPKEREKAAESAQTLDLAQQALSFSQEAMELAWRDGVTTAERAAIYAAVRDRTSQALALLVALIPQLPPARRVAANRLLKALTDAFEEVAAT